MGTLTYKKRQLTSFRILTMGFFIVIITGSLLLMLPFATKSGEVTSFFDAVFTATSATCVTGLVVRDTATYWSSFGQAVILIMIQIGGMGVAALAVTAGIISGKRIGLIQRSMMQEAIAAPSVGGIVRMTGFILRATIMIELAGAALMLPVFWKELGPAKGIWYALFHSISAFCNAGFDLMGSRTGAFSSLTGYVANGLINAVIIALIIIGGIGFLTWDDVKRNGIYLKKYRVQSKMILITSAILIVLPFLFFFFHEFGSPVWSSLTLGEKFKAAAFQSVTTRTAGFNTVDLTMFSEAGLMIMILLMLVGGSPGSTAGGMKTTTVAVLFMTLFSVFRRKEDTECFGRRIEENTCKYAATILMMYLTLFLAGGITISCIEGLPVQTCLFETASAIGTVGLTLGITTQVGAVSRLILIVLMFMGRVGGLTLVFAAYSEKINNMARLPKEKITVG